MTSQKVRVGRAQIPMKFPTRDLIRLSSDKAQTTQ